MTTPTTQRSLESRNVTAKAKWMPCPEIKTIEYPGLAYIYPLNELIVVKQSDDFHDLIGGNGTGYTIFNSVGQKVFLAVEIRGCKTFHINIFNHYGNKVIQVERLPKSFLNRVLVWAPPGNLVGTVKEVLSCVNTYLVQNGYGVVFLQIKAKGLRDCRYSILSFDAQGQHFDQVGRVENNWCDTSRINVENFGLSFPYGMDVTDKSLLLGACFLIACLKY